MVGRSAGCWWHEQRIGSISSSATLAADRAWGGVGGLAVERRPGYKVELDVWDWAAGQNFVMKISDALDRARAGGGAVVGGVFQPIPVHD